MSPPVCAICSTPLRLTAACRAVHEEHCHDCYRLSLAGGTPERHAHPTPETPVVLSARDVAALVRYQQHVQAITGTGPLAGLVTGEWGVGSGGRGGSGEWGVGSGVGTPNPTPYSLFPIPYSPLPIPHSLPPEEDVHG